MQYRCPVERCQAEPHISFYPFCHQHQQYLSIAETKLTIPKTYDQMLYDRLIRARQEVPHSPSYGFELLKLQGDIETQAKEEKSRQELDQANILLARKLETPLHTIVSPVTIQHKRLDIIPFILQQLIPVKIPVPSLRRRITLPEVLPVSVELPEVKASRLGLKYIAFNGDIAYKIRTYQVQNKNSRLAIISNKRK